MSDKVWNKAIKDTSGLKTFFEGNNANYVWKKRYNAYIYECLNQDVAKQVAGMLKSDTISSRTVINTVNKNSELNLRVRTGKFEEESTPYLKGRELKKGVNVAYEFEGKYYIVKVDEILAPTQKTMTEAKGAATSDYQTYLEKEWLAEIAKKHPIVIHEQVLYSLGK